jgi:hypothetical protein
LRYLWCLTIRQRRPGYQECLRKSESLRLDSRERLESQGRRAADLRPPGIASVIRHSRVLHTNVEVKYADH